MMSRIASSFLAAAGAALGHEAPPAPAASEVEALASGAAEAHTQLMGGNMADYRRVIQLAPDFTLMDPFGGAPTGTPASDADWQRIGRFFRDGTQSQFRLLNAYRSEGLIVLVANEQAHVAVGGLPTQAWTLRVTLVFRKDEGEWKLVHRHADPLAAGISLSEAARLASGGQGAGE